MKDGVDSVGTRVVDAQKNDAETKCNLCKKVAPDIFVCTVQAVQTDLLAVVRAVAAILERLIL